MILNKTIKELREQWESVSGEEIYRDAIARGYPSEKEFREIGESQTKGILNYLKQYNISITGKTIIEVGCGAGRLTEFLAKEAEYIYATDISQGMLNKLWERLGQIEHIETICTGTLDGIPENSADIIFSFLVFQHCPETLVKKFFVQGYKVLKPNGYYIFQIPIREKHEVVMSRSRATDMVRWTIDELKGLSEVAPYKLINSLDSYLNVWQKHE